MAIRPIKSLSKVSDQPILRSFKSCREINLQNIFGNLLVSAMEHLIVYLRGYRLQEFFNCILNKIPQAYSESFQMNYQEIYEDFEELFEKKQLKILNSMIFDSTFINFLVELQELNEVNDCKISQNEKLHMIEHLANQMRINVMVIHKKGKKTKFCVDDPYVSITIFEENGVMYILFPYEYKGFEMDDNDSHLEEKSEEDFRKNNLSLHLQIEDQVSPNRFSITINSPNLSRLSMNSPNASRISAFRLASPSNSNSLNQTEAEKRMALRAQLFKQQRKQVLDKSQSKCYDQENEDYSALTRNFSAEDYFIKDRNASLEDYKYFNFKGDFSLDAKDRIKWVKETELIKQEILKREELRKLESTFITEEEKVLENKRMEIDRIIEEKRKFFEERRIKEEKRLEEQRKKLNEAWSKHAQEVQQTSLTPKKELLERKAIEEAALLKERRLAELKIQEAELKLQQAFENYEAKKLEEEQRLAEELEKRIEEEKVLAEERRKDEEKQELIRKSLEAQKNIELEARLEQEKKDKEQREQREREEREREDREREERERKEQEDREMEEERLRIEEEERKAEQEKKLEDERIAREQMKAQKLQEAKRKRAQEEEENMKLAREKEAERKKIMDEKKRVELERKENEAKRKQEELEQQRIEEARIKKEDDERRAAEEKKKKEEEKRLADEKKKKEEEKRLADEKKKKEEEKRLADEKKKKEEEKRLADEKKRKAEESKKQVVEETYEESDNKSFCGGLYCAKCARDLKRSNYILKCDQCNDRYLRTHTSSFPLAPSVPQLKSCMECGAKISKGEEISCIRCFLQTKIFQEQYSPCTSCVHASKCYWIDASVGEDNQMILCGFCGEHKVKESVIIVCTGCNDKICLICLRKNTYVVEGICSNCHIRREPSLC